MHYEPRTIAFHCELLHPPQPVDPAAVQRVHNRMFQTGAPLYRSYNVTRDGATLSNPAAQPAAVSAVAFLGDRVRFREELTGLTTDDFAARVREVCGMALDERRVQFFTAQVVTIRTLINPRHYRDSRVFLKEGVFGFGEELAAFEREPQLYGMRLVFPPEPGRQNAFTLRVESFANDPRSLFLENQGSFGPVVTQQGLDPLVANIGATYDFLVQRVLAFLSQFDAHQEA